jgi:hypothetical protein
MLGGIGLCMSRIDQLRAIGASNFCCIVNADSDYLPHVAALFNPTTPTQDLPTLLPASGRNWQQPQQQVPWMTIPAVLRQLPSNEAGRNQRWGWSDDL